MVSNALGKSSSTRTEASELSGVLKISSMALAKTDLILGLLRNTNWTEDIILHYMAYS